ncbi:MAG: phosphoribosylanthranilate isomerase [Pseudomonadota bacterium]
MSLFIKICGLSTPETVRIAAAEGADCIGLVFFPPSPRNVDLDLAVELAAAARQTPAVAVAALTVDPDDTMIASIVDRVRPEMIQLHGRESPDRVGEIRQIFGLPVMKAVGIRARQDLDAVDEFAAAADRVLLDAKPPRNADRPGGNGEAFDWSLLRGLDLDRRFVLSGGLAPDNVAAAIRETGLSGVDVSSGVECAPGVKDADRIGAFIRNARQQEREGNCS